MTKHILQNHILSETLNLAAGNVTTSFEKPTDGGINITSVYVTAIRLLLSDAASAGSRESVITTAITLQAGYPEFESRHKLRYFSLFKIVRTASGTYSASYSISTRFRS